MFAKMFPTPLSLKATSPWLKIDIKDVSQFRHVSFMLKIEAKLFVFLVTDFLAFLCLC